MAPNLAGPSRRHQRNNRCHKRDIAILVSRAGRHREVSAPDALSELRAAARCLDAAESAVANGPLGGPARTRAFDAIDMARDRIREAMGWVIP